MVEHNSEVYNPPYRDFWTYLEKLVPFNAHLQLDRSCYLHVAYRLSVQVVSDCWAVISTVISTLLQHQQLS